MCARLLGLWPSATALFSFLLYLRVSSLILCWLYSAATQYLAYSALEMRSAIFVWCCITTHLFFQILQVFSKSKTRIFFLPEANLHPCTILNGIYCDIIQRKKAVR